MNSVTCMTEYIYYKKFKGGNQIDIDLFGDSVYN